MCQDYILKRRISHKYICLNIQGYVRYKTSGCVTKLLETEQPHTAIKFSAVEGKSIILVIKIYGFREVPLPPPYSYIVIVLLVDIEGFI